MTQRAVEKVVMHKAPAVYKALKADKGTKIAQRWILSLDQVTMATEGRERRFGHMPPPARSCS